MGAEARNGCEVGSTPKIAPAMAPNSRGKRRDANSVDIGQHG